MNNDIFPFEENWNEKINQHDSEVTNKKRKIEFNNNLNGKLINPSNTFYIDIETGVFDSKKTIINNNNDTITNNHNDWMKKYKKMEHDFKRDIKEVWIAKEETIQSYFKIHKKNKNE